MKYFVCDGSFLNAIQSSELRNLVSIGSSIRAPYENKALVEPLNHERGFITSIAVYLPKASKPKVFILEEKHWIKSETWVKLFCIETAYDKWKKEEDSKRSKLDAIDALVKASLEHGKRVFFHEINPPFNAKEREQQLRESGKAVSEARKIVMGMMK